MRLLEIASAEEQIALWRLVSDNVWAALQLQRDQEQRAAVSTAARNDTNAGVAAKPPKPKSRSKGTKNSAVKRVLRGYSKVPKLPSVHRTAEAGTKLKQAPRQTYARCTNQRLLTRPGGLTSCHHCGSERETSGGPNRYPN